MYAASELIDEITATSKRENSYPQTQLAARLKCIAQLIKADFESPITTRFNQVTTLTPPNYRRMHVCLANWPAALKAFHQDLKSAHAEDRVLTLCFSEFGRRVEENASLGTDHGTSGPVIIAGPVTSPLIGNAPNMTDLEDGDLKMQTDFRQVYATLLQDWLCVPFTPKFSAVLLNR